MEQILRLLEQYSNEEGCNMNSALRDALVDLHHIADKLEYDWDVIMYNAAELYKEEKYYQGE